MCNDELNDIGGVGHITEIKRSSVGIRLTFDYPVKFFWDYIPGTRPTSLLCRTVMFYGVFDMDEVLRLLQSLPLLEPERYQVDFSLDYAIRVSTPKMWRVGFRLTTHTMPRQMFVNGWGPLNGEYTQQVTYIPPGRGDHAPA